MLSRRQTEIVNLVVTGLSNREIAERLWLSERTVESHVAALFSKLNAGSRTELVARVLGDGLTSQTPRTNLPSADKRLIGREREIEEIRSALLDDRLVTLTGAGGVGKTRTGIAVATDVADRFRDGAWLTELAPVADGHGVARSIAQTLGVEPLPEQRPLEALVARLKRRSLLIVLDNCEHLIAQAAVVVHAILRACPAVRILATSREALKVAGERVYLLPSLSVPPPNTAAGGLSASEAAGYAAIALFVERARQADRRFALTDANASFAADISRRLDGIPLAIELAAARANVLSLEALAAMLAQRFAILSDGRRTSLPRHQTMRALFDWSYQLLSPAEQRLFDRLSVFAGGWTFEMADAVCAGDDLESDTPFELLASLVGKSLVAADLEAAEPHYRLSEPAREYAREKLAARGEDEAVARRHAIAYLELAERFERNWSTTPERAWLARARPDIENWRAALEFALGKRNDVIAGQQLAGALRLLFGRVAPAEGRHWVCLSHQLVDERTPPAISAKLEFAQAGLASIFAQHRDALGAARRALESYRALGEPVKAAFAQKFAGAALINLGEVAEGEALLREALAVARRLGDRRLLADVLGRLAHVASIGGDVARARAFHAEELATWTALGAEGAAAISATNLAELEFQAGDVRAALGLARTALATHRALGHTHNVAEDLLSLAAFLLALGYIEEAQASAREAFDLACELPFDLKFAIALQRIAAVALFRPAHDSVGTSSICVRATRLLGFVDALLTSLELRRHYIEQDEYDRMLVVLRAALGPNELSNLMANGATMTEAQAIEETELIGVAFKARAIDRKESESSPLG